MTRRPNAYRKRSLTVNLTIFVLKDKCIDLPHADSSRPTSPAFERILMLTATILKQI
jgi:hypothetical protein